MHNRTTELQSLSKSVLGCVLPLMLLQPGISWQNANIASSPTQLMTICHKTGQSLQNGDKVVAGDRLDLESNGPRSCMSSDTTFPSQRFIPSLKEKIAEVIPLSSVSAGHVARL